MRKIFSPFMLAGCLGALTSFIQPVFAQGTAFTYQGQLQNNGGPANGNFDFTFALFNTNSVNAGQVGNTLTETNVGVTNGLFTASLDFGSVFTGNPAWLAIGVRSNGGGSFTALNPLQSLTPTPYAIYTPNAGAAASANSVAATNIVGAITGDGSGLTNLNGASLAAGTVSSAQLAAGALAAPVSLVGTSVTATPNTSFVATNASLTTITLPGTANVGDVVTIDGAGAGGWEVDGFSSWTQQTSAPSLNWQSIASSSDGTHLAAVAFYGGIYTSVNSGTNWTHQVNAPNLGWEAVASSSDGSHLAAAVSSGGIYTSVNGGTNWTQQISAPNKLWVSVASSSDGVHLAAAANGASGAIYTSANSGTNWTQQSSAPTTNWDAVASSSDGAHLVAVVNGGGIYTSVNSGTSWTRQTVASATNWVAVASSADGARLVAVSHDYNCNIYTSVNGGTNWTLQTSLVGAYGFTVASSADGSRLILAGFGSDIYTSANSGTNWTEQDSAPTGAAWIPVASSADGSRLAAALNVGGIYTDVAQVLGVGAEGASAQFEYVGNGQWSAVTPAVANPKGVWGQSGTNYYYTNGNVGIGTRTPNYPLEVNGNIALDGTHLIFSNTAACVDVGAAGEFYWRVDSTTGLIGTYITPMTLMANGNLAINGTLSQSSDRNVKKDFAPVNAQDVLAKVAALPIEQWQYKADAGVRHLGPMAQDFHAAFGLNGPDDRHITTTDEEGVALAAIQGLNQKLEAETKEKDAAIEMLKAKADKVDSLEKQLDDLKQVVQALAEKK